MLLLAKGSRWLINKKLWRWHCHGFSVTIKPGTRNRILGPVDGHVVAVSHNWEDRYSGCEICEMGWTLTEISASVKKMVQNYGRLLKLCPCGKCRPEWFDCGWKCY